MCYALLLFCVKFVTDIGDEGIYFLKPLLVIACISSSFRTAAYNSDVNF